MLPPDDLIIRPTRTSDLEAVCEMVQGLGAYHGDEATLDPEQLAALTLGPRPWLYCLVATLSAEPVGYATLVPKVHVQFARRMMDLTNLFVIPQLRGQGIGKALISAACNEARLKGCQALTVGTAIGNTRAAALYREVGFADRPRGGEAFIMQV